MCYILVFKFLITLDISAFFLMVLQYAPQHGYLFEAHQECYCSHVLVSAVSRGLGSLVANPQQLALELWSALKSNVDCLESGKGGLHCTQ